MKIVERAEGGNREKRRETTRKQRRMKGGKEEKGRMEQGGGGGCGVLGDNEVEMKVKWREGEQKKDERQKGKK